jgi:molybdate transport system substrate-binding protein
MPALSSIERLLVRCTVLVLLICLPRIALCQTAQIAVAANFSSAANALKTAFEENSEHTISLSFSSTGKLYTQILHGAPFDAFFSADAKHAEQLISSTQASAESVFTYATGQLALFSVNTPIGPDTLTSHHIDTLAIANPKLAPYGEAAQQVLEHLGQSSYYANKLVQGDSVTQTYQMTYTGAASAGFVALSQVINQSKDRYWIVPQTMYAPILQKAVITEKGRTNEAIDAFFKFVKSREGQTIISHHGYTTTF